MKDLDVMDSMEKMLVQKAYQRQAPVNGSLELLPLCNMNCDMCYVRLSKAEMEQKGRLRTKEEWIRLAHQMKDAGTLFLLLTGGEPLLFPGFKELYIELQNMGMILTINTNGTLINEEWADFFQKYKPRRMNITLYGADDQAYEQLCHYPGGFQKTVNAVRMLRDREIDVKINGSITSKNEEDIRKISLINVPRDIMAYVKTYDENGKYSGRKLRQLCLAYAYGDGKAKSCKNAVDAVSKVLYGIPIDSYMSINLSAISVLNDAVGGVNVQVIGDLTSVDPTLKEGANVTLLGGQAETYVRSREFDPLDANMARMQRQQQYITAFAQKALQEMKGDLTLPLDLLNLVSENSVTNLSAPKITYLATKVSGSSFSSDNIYSIDCDIKEGVTGYAEYYPDETKLFEMILKVFYTQIS